MTAICLIVIFTTVIRTKKDFGKWYEAYKKHTIIILFICFVIDLTLYIHLIIDIWKTLNFN